MTLLGSVTLDASHLPHEYSRSWLRHGVACEPNNQQPHRPPRHPAMASNRLTFLYPHLFRTGGRWTEPAASHVVRSTHRNPPPLFSSPVCCQHAALFTTPSAGRQAAFAKRAGKGVQPLPLHDAVRPPPKSADIGRKEEEDAQEGQDMADSTAQTTQTPSQSSSEGNRPSTAPPPPNPPETIELPPPQDIDPITQTKKGSPMDVLLHRGPPPDSSSSPSPSTATADQPSIPPISDTNSESTVKPPNLKPSTYVHHFDSYTLVKQLIAGGYSLPQAIISMKGIRTLLASNLDVAQSGLVSKADVENETYLFRAACSELGAEVHNNRRVADEQLRQQRTLLQHEVDNLAQRLNQELLTLNDNVRGMFNDRRMAVREEQKATESRVCLAEGNKTTGQS